MKLIRNALQACKESRRALLALNALYGALIIGGMAYSIFDPSLRQELWQQINASFTHGPFAPLRTSPLGLSVLLIFGVNLFLGTFAVITLPSLGIPFSGLLVGVTRAALWGLLPPNPFQLSDAALVLGLFFVILVFLEGEAYILAMLAAYWQGRAFLWPRNAGTDSHWRGYWIGIRQLARLYPLIIAFLALAALYEELWSQAVQIGLLAAVR